MSAELFLILGAVALGFVLLAWIVNKKMSEVAEKGKIGDELVEWLKSNQQNLSQSNKNVTDTLQANTREINERLDRAAKVIGDLQKEAGQFSEVSRSMRDLQEFLQSPKLRGNIGEEVLKDLLQGSFPRHAVLLQYQFKSGNKVDAALKTDAGILPIDSKFPMENFERMFKDETKEGRERAKREFSRDVVRHIDDIAK